MQTRVFHVQNYTFDLLQNIILDRKGPSLLSHFICDEEKVLKY